MPKRKNNKNKRKNKNRSDVKNVSDDKGSDKCETCSSDSSHVINNEQIIVNDTKNQFVNACMAEVNVENTVLKIPELVLESSSSSLDQDLNNNSNDVQMLNQPVLNETNKEMQDKLCDIDNPNLNIYVVESPEQSLKSKSKLSSSIKSKSLDDDDKPKIVEITDEVISQSEEDNISSIVNTTNVIISDAESDMEWQKTDDLENQNTKNEVTGKLSITTIPLNVAQCELTKSLTPEEEVSLRNYLHTLNLSKHPSNFDSIEINAEIEHIVNREICHRLRKKGLAEDFLAQRLCPPRILDVIDEESGESSLTSRRHSYLSDKKSDIDELEDDVFEEKIKKVPKIGRDINIKPKHIYKNTGRLVPQQCILVDAKIKEPEISEARGNWTTRTVEKMSGAEIIYLTDSSSSTSSLHDLGGDETDDGAETDLSVRMITPTIEVTDTENLLKKTFVSNSDYNKTKDSESMSSKSDPQLENLKTIIDSGDNAAHEVIVLSTDNIKTDLYVKELDAKEISEANDHTRTDIELSTNKMVLNENTLHKTSDQYDLEIKVLKCELNNAMNNLIKEYSSDSEIAVEDNMKESFTRQDSSSSIGSSQCTAKYNPTYSSLNDVSNIIYDEAQEINQTKTISSIPTDSTKSHVIDVFKHITEDTAHNKKQYSKNSKQPSKLRDLCVLKIAAFPYGEKILQELAHVSKRLQNINVFSSKSTDVLEKSKTDLIEETNNKRKPVEEKSLNPVSEISSLQKNKPLPQQKKDIAPPVQPRKSSFKKSHVDHPQTAVHNDMKSNPTYLCQSPSQKMLMDKTNSVISEINDISNTTKNKSLEITKCNEFYAIKKANDEDINPSAVPFKSQTGSRLLALLRDPSVSNNLKNSTLIVNNKSFDNRNRNFTETSASNKYGQIISGERITSAKPIPPPRPKKYSAFYESDESSEFTDNSLRSIKSEKKIFHYSTGNLNKEIENDVSSIQNMHRYYTNVRDELNAFPRRPSLPKDLCDQQMEYIKKKEKEVEAEIHRLEGQKINASFIHKIGPKAPLISKKEFVSEMFGDADDNYYISHKKDASYSASASRLPEKGKLSSLFSSSQEEIFRNKMYSEYVSQMAERQERKQQKIIKITNNPTVKDKFFSKSMNELDSLDIKLNNRIEKEFISKARERWNKLGIKDPETEDEREDKQNVYCEPTKKVIEHKIKVFESGEERDVKKLPNHLQEFVRFATKDKKKESGSPGESENGPASSHVVILCAVMIIVLAFGKYFLHLFRNK